MIKIITNHLPGGWLPSGITKGLGGSEEAVVSLATALAARGKKVVVFHTQKDPQQIFYKDALYLDHSALGKAPTQKGTTITFKTHDVWDRGLTDSCMIHWSCDVERPWDTSRLNHFVNVSKFHDARNAWVPAEISRVIPFGVDIDSLLAATTQKKADVALYASSPDRGLETILKDWSAIKKVHPSLQLRVAYGFGIFDAIMGADMNAKRYKDYIREMMQQDGIVDLGWCDRETIAKEYWGATYWMLPLIKADSELFCLNAVKARICGALPVVNKIGALKDTVGVHIQYSDFLVGNLLKKGREEDAVQPQRWGDIVDQHWLKII